MPGIDEIYNVCGLPAPSTSDLAAWGELEYGDAASDNLAITVGLFGYDISCTASFCAEHDDFNEYCGLIAARGLDGLAFGITFNIDYGSDDGYYCAGFHKAESSDVMACFMEVVAPWFYFNNYWFPNNYTVTADFFDSGVY